MLGEKRGTDQDERGQEYPRSRKEKYRVRESPEGGSDRNQMRLGLAKACSPPMKKQHESLDMEGS